MLGPEMTKTHKNQKARARQAISVNLTPTAGAVVSSVRREMGITQTACIERLLEWFGAQDPRVRTAIMSSYAEVRRGLATLVLDELRANPLRGVPPGMTPEQSFDGLIDHTYDRVPDAVEGGPEGEGSRRRRAARGRDQKTAR
jgi:hypothetical protein